MAAYAALVSVMHIIDDLQLHPRPPISLHQNQLHLLTQKVTFLQEFLEGYNPHLGYTAEADPLESHIADAAYAAEDVIESHIVDQITSDGEKFSSDALYYALGNVIEEMTMIEKEAMKIKDTVGGVQHQLHTKSTPPDSWRASSSITQKKSRMVGVDDALLEMKDKLTSYYLDLQIIPIVGMGGSGKTTLAINIYHNRFIKERFDICAWATISQEYSIQEILTQVLGQLNQNVGQNLSEDELGEKLYKYLFGRRYMIVMDDMWTIKAWDGVRRFLPDNGNGSRIVITTRMSNLASELSNSDNLEMKLLDEANSWDLLSKTVFGEEGCPVELEEIGKEIGKACKGLPLSIVVVGGFLAKSKQTREFWKYTVKNINEIVNLQDDDRCLKILHMSYKQLPVYLKPCFLYMGVFPEDGVICISRLIKIWIAEGFLKPINGKNLEEVARVYLKDLTDRNLVLIEKMGISGNIKECKLHDLLRDLCLREAQKERFYSVISTPSSCSQRKVSCQRRIVFSSTSSKKQAKNILSSMSVARSLIWNVEYEKLPRLNFRLLRILFPSTRVRSVGSEKFLDNIHQSVNSRFLAFSVPSECLFPSSVWLFWNLQTLIVHEFGGVTAPINIWHMPHIRHLQFIGGLSLPAPPNGHDDIVLRNLRTLGRIKNFECSEQVVKRIPNIKKLQLIYKGSDNGRSCLNNLDCLDKLESLTCRYFRGTINFPHSLKKLSLQIEDYQCWEDILDKIGVLPLLQKLTLRNGAFKEGRWETTEDQFCSLKFLSVRGCKGLQVWTTDSSHFPCLEQLVVDEVSGLKEIPLEFAEISTLSLIELALCEDSVIDSAIRILESQEELYGEATVQVRVKLLSMSEEQERSSTPNLCYSQYRF